MKLPTIVACDNYAEDLVYCSQMCESSLGPLGGLKMLLNSSNGMTVTSSSSRLLPRLQLDHPLGQFLLQAVSSLPDHGLYSAALAARLLGSGGRAPGAGGEVDLQMLGQVLEDARVEIDIGSLPHLVALEDDLYSTGVLLYHLKVSVWHAA